MERFVRGRVPAVTALLSLVSLALVFGAALRVGPATALPRAPAPALAAIPHVNAVLSVAAIGTILAGWRAIRRGAVQRHRRLMLASFALFATFLLLYLYRVAVEGPTEFAGPAGLRTTLYLPLLAIHVLLAIVSVPLVYYALLLAYVHPISRLSRTRHPQIGRAAAALWLISFALGIAVYFLLYVLF